jgi:hypothetical protein
MTLDAMINVTLDVTLAVSLDVTQLPPIEQTMIFKCNLIFLPLPVDVEQPRTQSYKTNFGVIKSFFGVIFYAQILALK